MKSRSPIGVVGLVLIVCVAAVLVINQRSAAKAQRAQQMAALAQARAVLDSFPESEQPAAEVQIEKLLKAVAPVEEPEDVPPPPDEPPVDQVTALLAELAQIAADPDFEMDARGVAIVDALMALHEAGLSPEEQARIVAALDSVLNRSKLRPARQSQLYDVIAEALGRHGPEGAEVMIRAYEDRFRFRATTKVWQPLRGRLLRNIGRTKDEANVKFLLDEARRSPAADLQTAGGEGLGYFDGSAQELRKEIVSGLLITMGALLDAAKRGRPRFAGDDPKLRLETFQRQWFVTLRQLTGQDFATVRAWQIWHMKNKDRDW